MRTIDELLKEAYDVQDACNLSGVVHSFSRAMTELRENGINNTEELNTHPVCVLYADKIASLTNTQGLSEAIYPAYQEAVAAMHRLRELTT